MNGLLISCIACHVFHFYIQTPVDTPLIIIGLPRSGTTLLQRLMSSDSQFLSPMFWEMLASVPPGRPENWKECDRYTKLAKTERE